MPKKSIKQNNRFEAKLFFVAVTLKTFSYYLGNLTLLSIYKVEQGGRKTLATPSVAVAPNISAMFGKMSQ